MATRALVTNKYGAPNVLSFQDIPDPKAGEGQILVDVVGAGVNPADWKITAGYLAPMIGDHFPYTPGLEVSGKVAAIGPGVTDFKVGDEVFGSLGLMGGFATRVAAPAAMFAPKPKKVSLLDAGGIACAAMSAYQALHEVGGLKSGQQVLIHAAAGGVGGFAVQFAKVAGATVTGTASGANVDYVKSLGATRVIDYKKERFEDSVSNIDLVLDLMGGEVQDRSWAVMKKGGILICLVGPPNEEKAKAAGVRAAFMSMSGTGGMLRKISALIDEGKVKIETTVRPMSQAVQVMEASMAGHGRGKIVLDASK